jgi:hypothetical protein
MTATATIDGEELFPMILLATSVHFLHTLENKPLGIGMNFSKKKKEEELVIFQLYLGTTHQILLHALKGCKEFGHRFTFRLQQFPVFFSP